MNETKTHLYLDGLISSKQLAGIYYPWRKRSVLELEIGLAATSTEWDVLYNDAVRNTCTIDQCDEKWINGKPISPARHVASIKSFTATIVSRAINNDKVEQTFWRVFEDLLTKRMETHQDYLCANYAIHRVVLRRK